MNQTELVIRPAVRADVPYLVAFNQAMAQETEGKILADAILTNGVQRLFDHPQFGQYWLAEVSGEVVGSLLLTYEWTDWRDGLIWWIQSVYVRPETRRMGIFKAMYCHVETLARADKEVRGLRLYVEEENHRAQKTYASLGMERTHYLMYEVIF